MTVVRPGKPDRVVEMKGWKKGDGLGLVRYTAPAKERGTAYLRSGANTWLYLPSAEKVVRVGAKQNFGGGDFSNADIFRLSLVNDYVPTLAGEETWEGQPCYRLDLKAKDRSVAYDRVVYRVRSDGTFFPVHAEYYTISGRRLKWLTLADVARLGRPRAADPAHDGERAGAGARTVLRFLAIEDDVTLDDRMFTPSALERGRMKRRVVLVARAGGRRRPRGGGLAARSSSGSRTCTTGPRSRRSTSATSSASITTRTCCAARCSGARRAAGRAASSAAWSSSASAVTHRTRARTGAPARPTCSTGSGRR